MLWGDFLHFKKIKRSLRFEINIIKNNILIIAAAAAVCCIGGILLWINGGSTWYVANSALRGKYPISQSGIFLLNCMAYVLLGILLALNFIYTKNCLLHPRTGLSSFVRSAGSYLFLLIWYVIFFCTRLTIFSLALLIISGIMLIVNLISTKKIFSIYGIITITVFALIVVFVHFGIKVSMGK